MELPAIREPKGTLEKGSKRHGSLAAGGHREVSWGNSDPVKCHLFPQVPFQQQREGGHHACKATQGGGKAQNSGDFTSTGKSFLPKQDMENVYVKGSQAKSFSILPKQFFERLGELGMSSPEKRRLQGALRALSRA